MPVRAGWTVPVMSEAVRAGSVRIEASRSRGSTFTRPIVDHVFRNYDGVLKVDGDVGSKKVYDPRAWGRAAEAGMAERVTQACSDLKSTGTRLT